jgi:hypothetical protein
MTHGEFEAAVQAAEILRHTSDALSAEFWMGYLFGLRRHFHDDARQARGSGYHCGVGGRLIADAMAEARRLRDPVRRAP